MRYLFSRKIVTLSISLLLGLLIGLGWNMTHVSAQSKNILSSEITTLRNRINRLESQVTRLSQLVSQTNQTIPPSSSPPRVDNTPIGASDPMFKRLATLVIELKEEVRELEKRVEQLENDE